MITRLLIVVVAGLAVWVLAVAGSMPVAPIPNGGDASPRLPPERAYKGDRLPLPTPCRR